MIPNRASAELCLLKNGDWLRRPKPGDMSNQHRPAPPARGRRCLSPFFDSLQI
jgi:hypothetical protein